MEKRMALAFVQSTAQWRPSAPDVEPPSFDAVWHGFETGAFEIDRLVVRHGKSYEKRALRSRSFGNILTLNADWSSLPWSMDLPKKFRRYIHDDTSGHLSIFFRQSVNGAARVLDFWKPWGYETSDELSQVVAAPEEQLMIRRIVEIEAEGKLLLSFWGERDTAIWFGEHDVIQEMRRRQHSART